MNYTEFETIIKEKFPIHLAGIGGVSMRALAELLHHMGAAVQGSDRDESVYTQRLREMGINVKIGHAPENPLGAALVIRTAAISDENPEIISARKRNIPVIERAQAWGLIMRTYKNVVCVAGTHGKTSTTSMITAMTMQAKLDPTVMVGGDLAAIGGSLRIGHSNLMVAEACEYKNSFLNFRPTTAVILNVDRDHLDFFSDTDDIIAAFTRFANLVPPTGTVIVNYDDANAMRAVETVDRRKITFGFTSEADIYPENVIICRGVYSCDIYHKGQLYSHVTLSVPGVYNLSNALASAAVAITLGIDAAEFAAGLEQYTGVGRRFELKQHWRGADVYDDYAHHPSEIAAALQAAQEMEAGRVICVFQPHTYSRTVSLLQDFAQALQLADQCILCPIFAARETNTWGISSADLAALIPGAVCAESLEDAAVKLQTLVQEGDIIFTMGAGDVFRVNDYLK